MCGLVYGHSFVGPVNNYILQQYDAQKHRGTEGFGLFDGKMMHMVHEAKENKILKWLVKYNSEVIMFHHRNPTSTINCKKAAHPFSTKGYFGDTQYILIHNGYIRNSVELFCDHQELGIEYQSLLQDMTFNDSEALLWDFALYMEGKQDKMKAEGAIAFICMKLEGGVLTRLYFDRNTNPLYMDRDKEGLRLSSEGDGIMTTPGRLYTYNYQLNRLTERWLKLDIFTAAPYLPPAPKPYSSDYDYSDSSSFWDNHETLGKDYRNGTLIGKTYPVVEYVHNQKTQVMEPVTVEREVDYEDGLNLLLRYLMGADGNFEMAYWRLEGAYELLESKDKTPETIKSMLTIDKAMEIIDSDPEYVDSRSVSSKWRELWKTTS